MSHYQVLARKYRPQIFHDVVGQDAIVTTLKNAITLNRTAHAYLFCGTRGTGKTTLARLFAKALNCPNRSQEGEPCNNCSSCLEIAACNSMDVLEIDGASHRGIEDVRQINETIGFAPVSKRYKIYLIDEVHMLTKEAFNALLKTLEEPPPHVTFFFCTTEPHKIPSTILSRCQRFNLRRITLELLVKKLSAILIDNKLEFDTEALHLIAQKAEGSLRDALSLLDQVIAFDQTKISSQTVTSALGLPSKELFFSLARAGEQKDWLTAFRITEEVFVSGKNLSFFLEELTEHFRTLLLLKNGLSTNKAYATQYLEIAPSYQHSQLLNIMELLVEAQQQMKSAPSERTFLEMLLLKILRSHHQIPLENLVERLISLEHSLSRSEPIQANILQHPNIEKSPETLPVQVLEKTQKKAAPIPTAEKEKPPVAHKDAGSLEAANKIPAPHSPTLSIEEQSRFDTLMRFAAKELNGSLNVVVSPAHKAL